MDGQANKPHRKGKDKKQRPAGSENPKANTFANAGRFIKQAARSHDHREKRLHVPLVDRIPEEAPPLIVAVVGPPQVGKTTLIKSLIRRYTKQTISDPKGPLTVITSKRRRLTFIECPSDSLAGMIDIAKVVDIVLLMIDGKYGFEMETMEFLNVLSASGMPGNVFGILTKLDMFKKQDTLRTQKKRLKHRFWSELYQGAKLFYLSGVINGRYPDREVLNLSRFLSVMKNPRPLVWRNAHPYCLADRFLDITPPTDIETNPKCDRTVALYGYLRGTNFPAEGARVHVPGLGDLNVKEIEALPDPCPTPFMDQQIAQKTGKAARRRLGDKQKVLFAPMSDVGGVLVDKDAVYIDVKTNTFDKEAAAMNGQEDRGLGEQMMLGLQGDRRLLGQADQGLQLFENGTRRPMLDAEVGPTQNGTSGDRLGDDEEFDEDDGDESDDDEGMGTLNEDSDDEFGEDSAFQRNGLEDDDEESSDGLLLPRSGDSQGIESHDDYAFADSDSEIGSLSSADIEQDANSLSDDDKEGGFRWKQNLTGRAEMSHAGVKRKRRTADLSRLIYDLTITPKEVVADWSGVAVQDLDGADDLDEGDDQLFTQKRIRHDDAASEDRMIPLYNYDDLEVKWSDPELLRMLKKRVASKRRSAGNADDDDDEEDDEEDDEAFGMEPADEDEDDDFEGFNEELEESEGDGEFEDLETGQVNAATQAKKVSTLEEERERNAKKKEELKLRFEEEDREGFANDKNKNRKEGVDGTAQDFAEDEWYDAQKAKIQKQLDINRAEFDEMDDYTRTRAEGFRAGTYARIVLSSVPCEFSEHFNPRMPVLVGGLSPTEERFGYVQVRIKRHRWHQKILKTNDPLIFSLGWRRFQTIPIYSIHENRQRNRMLKYTPEHMHCTGTFWGPLIAPNTGFCCVQSFSSKNPGFRIAATGVVLSVDESTEIVKKLKLKGYPHKIYKNTAIIKDMFASDLEIAKFKSGNLRTVSGIRGMVKGRAGKQFPEGYIRAGFEDKILMSDIIFLSAWRTVKPREFYMTVTNMLDDVPQRKALTNGEADDANGKDDAAWRGMRLTGEVRAEQGISVPSQRDSLYRGIERPERHFNPLRVPRKLQADLPFKSQITMMKPQKKETYMQKRAVVLGGEEKRARDLLQKLSTIRNEKVEKRRVAQDKRKESYRKEMAENIEKKEAREKREKSEYWRREGKKRMREEEGGASNKKYKKSRSS